MTDKLAFAAVSRSGVANNALTCRATERLAQYLSYRPRDDRRRAGCDNLNLSTGDSITSAGLLSLMDSGLVFFGHPMGKILAELAWRFCGPMI